MIKKKWKRKKERKKKEKKEKKKRQFEGSVRGEKEKVIVMY